MSFNPPGPAVGPTPGQMPGSMPGAMPGQMPGQMPGPVGAPTRRSDGASLVAAIGGTAMVFMELVLLVASLLVAKNLSYLGVLVGLSTDYIDSPTQFTSWDVAMTGTLVVAVFGCLTGRSWGRSVVVTAMVLNAYPLLATLVNAVRTSDGRTAFTQGHNLWFNLVMIIEFLIAVGTFLAVLMASASTRGGSGSTSQPAPAYPAQPMPQPMPMQGQPFVPQQPAPGYQAQPMPPQPMPQPMSQPMPPQATPQPGPAQPGQVHQGPLQQPTPTQQADAYRPTEFSPRPPEQQQPGYPPTPPGQPGA